MADTEKTGAFPFELMIRFFREKLNIPTERYTDVLGKMHNQFFSVAGAQKLDLLQDLREAVDEFISTGSTLTEFLKKFKEIKEKHGWIHTGTESARSAVIYDTNIRQAYHAGREEQMSNPRLRSVRPYGLYKHGDSINPRESHLAWHNKVVPLDDPWWDTHTPMNDYFCSCKKFMLSERDVSKRGLTITAGSEMPHSNQFYEHIDKNGEKHQVPHGVGFGFDYTPKIGAKAVLAKKDQYDPELFKYYEQEQEQS